MSFVRVAFVAGIISVGSLSPAMAVTFSQSVSEFADRDLNSRYHSLRIPVDRRVFSDSVFRISAFGDFDGANEFIKVCVEGKSFGRFLNSDSSDDDFVGPAGDAGNSYQSPLGGALIIFKDELKKMVKDGILHVRLRLSRHVDNLQTGEFLGASITYENVPAPVPAPAALPMAAAGAALLAAAGLRRRTRA